MNLHEYQAKKILKKFGVPIPEFGVASTVEEAEKVAKELNLKEAVLKIQVHAGGRGKAGGVKFAKSPAEIAQIAKELIGMKMVNQQTGPMGVTAREILISRPANIAKEYYLALLIDRKKGTPKIIASQEGGMEIEELAVKSPEKILQVPFAISGKLRSYQMFEILHFMGWQNGLKAKGRALITALAKCFIAVDASLLEINPLITTKEGDLIALDAKLSIDDNALFRQKEALSYYDPSQVSQQEAKAKEFDLAYIAMQGEIGCMVNGAGLAMATMDIIELSGSSPANFLDVGGSATKEKVSEGFKIILSDPKVKAILVNIFGGIMNCVTIAEGIISAAKELAVKVPIVARLEGNHAEEGRALLEKSGLKLQAATDLQDAAKKVVAKVKG